MARYKAITPKDRKQALDKKRGRILMTADGIYVLLLVTGILTIGINQFNPLFVGWGMIIMGGISIPVACFHIYITKKGWSRSVIHTENDPEVKIVTALEIIFLTACSIVLPALGVLRLLGFL